jgi:hypothetical protein
MRKNLDLGIENPLGKGTLAKFESSLYVLLPRDPFTVKIHAILVQIKRSQKNAFGAALHTIPFDRVNGDI